MENLYDKASEILNQVKQAVKNSGVKKCLCIAYWNISVKRVNIKDYEFPLLMTLWKLFERLKASDRWPKTTISA